MTVWQNDSDFVFSSPLNRPAPARKASRMRFAWFAIGTIFGAGLVYYVVSILQNDPVYAQNIKTQRGFALLDEAIAPLPPLPVQTADAKPTAKMKLALPRSLDLSVQPGDTLISLLMENGITHDEAAQIILSMKPVYNPRKLVVGQSLKLQLDKSKIDAEKPIVSGMRLDVSPLKAIEVARKADRFAIREVKAPVYKGYARAGGRINSSLYQTGTDAGIPPQMLNEIINAFSYDVDFQRDIHPGDQLDVVFERMHTEKNVSAGLGKVIYASLVLGGKTLTVYRHASSDGFSGYYNAKGESVKKALLRTPINGSHITSGFGMRMHPLLGYTKMHKGVDFGAVTGTPIYAAGDGIVAYAGTKSGYGNYVAVKHSNAYTTAYAHASRFAKGIKVGARVKQGQVIAYVGATGNVTGPHLHYEILVNNQQVNPSGVKFRTGQTLAGKEFAQFKKDAKLIRTALATLPRNTTMASLGPVAKTKTN